MRNELRDATWSEEQLSLLLESLSRRSGLRCASAEIGSPVGHPNSISSWIDSACEKLNLESERLNVLGRDLHLRLKQSPPAILQIDEQKFLGLLTWRRNVAILLGPDGGLYKIAGNELVRSLRSPFEEPFRAELEKLLDQCGVRSNRRSAAAETLLRERLQNKEIVRAWELRSPPSSSFQKQLKDAGLYRKLACFVGASLLEHSLWLASWYVIGFGALEGRFDEGWLLAWALLLGMMIPFRIWSTWLRGYLAIGFGGLIQQRLLAGILQQKKTDDADGIGRTVGKIIESGQIEGLALTGGLLAILACLETFFAGAVLFSGAGGGVHVSLFIGLLLLTLLLAAKTMTRSKTWTDTRLALTGDLVERIAGHRTRLAQESVSAWHTNEDRILERYLEQSRAADESVAYLAGPIPRAWLVIGLAGFLPAMLSAEVSVSSLAVGLGGILLGQQALHRLCQSIGSLIGAGVAWKQVRPLFQAGGEVAAAGRWLPPSVEISGLRAECINFCYQASARVVLNDVSLTVAKNERLLIEGDSGSGKSTLLSILTGLERPTSGLLLAGGMDIQTMGLRNWRKRIVYAPQFHQNHVFSGTFAFNLLMGRCWPPAEKDLHEAEAVCEELGLGGLLNRMPGGLFQMVGDTGWRLSQGERSRLFIARALLQQADFVVLDESFSSLDPENLEQAMHCVRMRAKALIVAAHP